MLCQVSVGVVDASLADAYGVKGGSGVAMLKYLPRSFRTRAPKFAAGRPREHLSSYGRYGTAEKAAKRAKVFGATDAAVGDAKKAALESISDSHHLLI